MCSCPSDKTTSRHACVFATIHVSLISDLLFSVQVMSTITSTLPGKPYQIERLEVGGVRGGGGDSCANRSSDLYKSKAHYKNHMMIIIISVIESTSMASLLTERCYRSTLRGVLTAHAWWLCQCETGTCQYHWCSN